MERLCTLRRLMFNVRLSLLLIYTSDRRDIFDREAGAVTGDKHLDLKDIASHSREKNIQIQIINQASQMSRMVTLLVVLSSFSEVGE